MEKTDKVEKTVKEIIAEVLDIDVLRLDNEDEQDLVDDYGADSLDLVEIQMGLEEEYNLVLEDVEVEKLHTVGQVVELVKSRV